MKALARIRAQLSRLRRDERGATIMLLTVMIAVILGFAGMVTDAGTAYWNRRMLQNAVDGAALAGAASLPNNTSTAISTAQTYALNNGVTSAELGAFPGNPQVSTTFNGNDTITVSVQRLDNFGLRYVIGGTDANIVAQAQAIAVALQPTGIWPVAVPVGTNCTLGCTMKFGATGNYDGNFGPLDLGNAGSNAYGNEFTNGWSGSIPPPTVTGGQPTWDWTVYTETGNVVGDTRSSATTLMSWDSGYWCDGGQTSCQKLYQAPPQDGFDYQPLTPDGTICLSDLRCPRVGIIPLIQQSWSGLNGHTPVTVVGFGCFYLQSVSTGGGQGLTTVTGKFLSYCNNVGGVNGSTPIPGVPLGSTGLVGWVLWR